MRLFAGSPSPQPVPRIARLRRGPIQTILERLDFAQRARPDLRVANHRWSVFDKDNPYQAITGQARGVTIGPGTTFPDPARIVQIKETGGDPNNDSQRHYDSAPMQVYTQLAVDAASVPLSNSFIAPVNPASVPLPASFIASVNAASVPLPASLIASVSYLSVMSRNFVTNDVVQLRYACFQAVLTRQKAVRAGRSAAFLIPLAQGFTTATISNAHDFLPNAVLSAGKSAGLPIPIPDPDILMVGYVLGTLPPEAFRVPTASELRPRPPTLGTPPLPAGGTLTPGGRRTALADHLHTLAQHALLPSRLVLHKGARPRQFRHLRVLGEPFVGRAGKPAPDSREAEYSSGCVTQGRE